MALDARYVPVGIERNGKRVSDAVPPIAFAEITGLLDGDHPVAAFKIEGIAADPSAIVELLVKEKLMFHPKVGQNGIAPLALIHDTQKNIHCGYALVGAEKEAELLPCIRVYCWAYTGPVKPYTSASMRGSMNVCSKVWYKRCATC